jgi:hypothetical protein
LGSFQITTSRIDEYRASALLTYAQYVSRAAASSGAFDPSVA